MRTQTHTQHQPGFLSEHEISHPPHVAQLLAP